MNKFTCLIIFSIFFLQLPPSPAAATDTGPASQEDSENPTIIFEGKVSCPLTRAVFMPFPGIFTDIQIKPGALVEKDELIARYILDEEKAIQIGRGLLFKEIDDLTRYQGREEEKLAELRRREQELKELVLDGLAPTQLMEKLQAELKLTKRYLKVLEKRSRQAKIFAEKSLNHMRDILGDNSLEPGQIPDIVRLKSPISGRVLSLHPQLKKDAFLPGKSVIATIGTMETMVIKSLVYEKDVVHLRSGTQALFYPDSLPEKTFPATITRVNWIPVSQDPNLPSYYQVEIQVDNSNMALRPGFKGRVEYKPPTD